MNVISVRRLVTSLALRDECEIEQIYSENGHSKCRQGVTYVSFYNGHTVINKRILNEFKTKNNFYTLSQNVCIWLSRERVVKSFEFIYSSLWKCIFRARKKRERMNHRGKIFWLAHSEKFSFWIKITVLFIQKQVTTHCILILIIEKY